MRREEQIDDAEASHVREEVGPRGRPVLVDDGSAGGAGYSRSRAWCGERAYPSSVHRPRSPNPPPRSLARSTSLDSTPKLTASFQPVQPCRRGSSRASHQTSAPRTRSRTSSCTAPVSVGTCPRSGAGSGENVKKKLAVSSRADAVECVAPRVAAPGSSSSASRTSRGSRTTQAEMTYRARAGHNVFEYVTPWRISNVNPEEFPRRRRRRVIRHGRALPTGFAV